MRIRDLQFERNIMGSLNDLSQLPNTGTPGPEAPIHLDLWIRDRELSDALGAVADGRPREEFAISALRIGVLALRQAQGRVDADAVRVEGDRLIASLAAQLSAHQGQVTVQLANTLREYFDPASGRFSERVDKLVKQDGELAQVLRATTDQSVAALKATLDPYIGHESPLLQLLQPGDSNQLMVAIKKSIDDMVMAQQTRLLDQFSLDNKGGALAKLVAEVTTQNGSLTTKLQGSIQEVVREFSLDSDDSALSRLVRRVEAAQRQISAEFTLDSNNSALSRMKRDLTDLFDAFRKDSTQFQQTVIAALESMKARKQESLASTTHGRDFEDVTSSFISDVCQQASDIFERTGSRTGKIRNCKKGDCVIIMGPDTDSAGARIVCEAKEDQSYDLPGSLAELAEAKDNREASVGLFIHSARTAPAGLRPLNRYGNDVIVVWDAENSGSDVFLSAGLMVCKALALRKAAMTQEFAADIELLDKAIREIERQAGYLGDIETSSHTIKNGAEKILKRIETMRTSLAKQIAILDEQSQALRNIANGGAGQ